MFRFSCVEFTAISAPSCWARVPSVRGQLRAQEAKAEEDRFYLGGRHHLAVEGRQNNNVMWFNLQFKRSITEKDSTRIMQLSVCMELQECSSRLKLSLSSLFMETLGLQS